MNIEEIKNLWAKDSPIDTDYHVASRNIPQLHSKYLNLYCDEKAVAQTMTRGVKTMRRIRYEYYTGTIEPELLDKYNWEPYLKKILKTEVGMYLDACPVLSGMELELRMQEEKVSFLDSVLRMINQRNFQIKEAISWQKFVSGN